MAKYVVKSRFLRLQDENGVRSPQMYQYGAEVDLTPEQAKRYEALDAVVKANADEVDEVRVETGEKDYADLTYDRLKALAKERDLDTSGNKDALAERLAAADASAGPATQE